MKRDLAPPGPHLTFPLVCSSHICQPKPALSQGCGDSLLQLDPCIGTCAWIHRSAVVDL